MMATYAEEKARLAGEIILTRAMFLSACLLTGWRKRLARWLLSQSALARVKGEEWWWK